MAMGKMVLHSLVVLLLMACIACSFRNNGVAGTTRPSLEGMPNTKNGIASSSWWTLSSWLACSSLIRMMPSKPLREGRERQQTETSPASSVLSCRELASWLASFCVSSRTIPCKFFQETEDRNSVMSSLPPSSSAPQILAENSPQAEAEEKEKDKDFGVAPQISYSPRWWLSWSSFSAATSTQTGATHNESKETTFCPPSCFRPNPVCGIDGITYWCGSVDAECAGVEVDYTGFCDFDRQGTGGKGVLAIQSFLLVHMIWLMLAAFLVFLGVL